ncbi:transposase family protein [Streptomyces sioyaensis]|uniref:transposase family protein n=1 Tax=Streptomyces sioyaensis TaxID=67364 RepID=UPI003F53EDD3
MLAEGELVVVQACAVAALATCPGCGVASARVHSRYVRRLADSAVGHRGVVIEVGVRRFRCREPACTRATLPGMSRVTGSSAPGSPPRWRCALAGSWRRRYGSRRG